MNVTFSVDRPKASYEVTEEIASTKLRNDILFHFDASVIGGIIVYGDAELENDIILFAIGTVKPTSPKVQFSADKIQIQFTKG